MGLLELLGLANEAAERPPLNDAQKLDRDANRLVDPLADACAEVQARVLPSVFSDVMKAKSVPRADGQRLVAEGQIVTLRAAANLLAAQIRKEQPSPDDDLAVNSWVRGAIDAALRGYSGARLFDDEARAKLGYCSIVIFEKFLDVLAGRDVLETSLALAKVEAHFRSEAKRRYGVDPEEWALR